MSLSQIQYSCEIISHAKNDSVEVRSGEGYVKVKQYIRLTLVWGVQDTLNLHNGVFKTPETEPQSSSLDLKLKSNTKCNYSKSAYYI